MKFSTRSKSSQPLRNGPVVVDANNNLHGASGQFVHKRKNEASALRLYKARKPKEIRDIFSAPLIARPVRPSDQFASSTQELEAEFEAMPSTDKMAIFAEHAVATYSGLRERIATLSPRSPSAQDRLTELDELAHDTLAVFSELGKNPQSTALVREEFDKLSPDEMKRIWVARVNLDMDRNRDLWTVKPGRKGPTAEELDLEARIRAREYAAGNLWAFDFNTIGAPDPVSAARADATDLLFQAGLIDVKVDDLVEARNKRLSAEPANTGLAA